MWKEEDPLLCAGLVDPHGHTNSVATVKDILDQSFL